MPDLLNKKKFLVAIFFLENAFVYTGGSCRQVLLIFNSKHRKTNLYLLCNLKKKRSKISTARVPGRKKSENAAMTTSIAKVPNRREKMSLASCKYLSKNLWKVLLKLSHPFGLWNWHTRKEIKKKTTTQTDRHTGTQTHIHTDPRVDRYIFSQ